MRVVWTRLRPRNLFRRPKGLSGMEPRVDFDDYCAARWRPLVRSAVLLGCSLPEAEDVVQAALEKTYRHWDRVRRARSVDAYVHRAVLNALRTSRRRRWWGEVPTETLPDDAADSAGASGIDVRRALMALPHPQRQVIVLRFYSDLTELATAEVLGVPLGTVKSRTARAIASLAGNPLLMSMDGEDA